MEEPLSFLDWELSFHEDYSKTINAKISQLLKKYSDKKTLYKTAGLSDSSFHLERLDFQQGILECSIDSKGFSHTSKILIDRNNKVISHRCDEFKSSNRNSKSFCSHLIKLFLILQEEEPIEALYFLEDISVNDYESFLE
ncbi:MAG: hypothetical protein BAJALOKI1v1_1530001 [Promethearchaeota archaeon]|nr:MAG: hypothetical protein BAJALOKI1v1_1530001 [Candidatus Lokiarchaeota archaeon]